MRLLAALFTAVMLGACAGPTLVTGESKPSARATEQEHQLASRILDDAMASSDFTIKSEAYSALGASRRSDATGKLLAAPKEDNGELRFGAARGLGKLGDRSVGEPVAAAFRAEKGWKVKQELASTAGLLMLGAVAPELREALSSEQKELRIAAAWALEDLGDARGKEALAELGNPTRPAPKEGTERWARKVLEGKKEGDRVLAARTLAERGGPEDGRLLAGYLSAAEPLLRLWSAAGLLRWSGAGR